jgi:hypothetical protein
MLGKEQDPEQIMSDASSDVEKPTRKRKQVAVETIKAVKEEEEDSDAHLDSPPPALKKQRTKVSVILIPG